MAEYTVTLALKVQAEDEADAVLAFVDYLTAQGLRKWNFGVAQDSVDLGVFNGYGDKTNLPADYDENDNSDEALLAAAAHLNQD